jgi:hypothetical protein
MSHDLKDRKKLYQLDMNACQSLINKRINDFILDLTILPVFEIAMDDYQSI